MLRIVIGIGNPGREYADTRHNAGFQVIELLARRHAVTAWKRQFDAEVGEWRDDLGQVLLLKPRTFVNRTGETVQAVLAFLKLPVVDLLIVVDDINLPLGTLRLRGEGSAGGHNGLRDIEARIGQTYARLRLGVGAPPSAEHQIGHVLGPFTADERTLAQAMFRRAAECVERWRSEGVVVACTFNGPQPAPPGTSQNAQSSHKIDRPPPAPDV